MKDDPLNRTKARRGSTLAHAKLTEYDVSLIRKLIDEREKMRAQVKNLSNRAIAEKFDVHVRSIDRISTGENWGHVK